MNDKLSLLAVFAHPDDESCGPGATLAMYAHRRVRVALLCFTHGERGAWGADQTIPLEEFGGIRTRELADACVTLGISQWNILRYPDGEVSKHGLKVLELDILMRLWRTRPQVVITHWPEGTEGHPDHDAVSRAATEAFAHAGDSRFCKLIPDCPPFEPLRLYYAVPPDPELVKTIDIGGSLTELDVSAFTQAKARALLCHLSQEECWREQIGELRRAPKWTESFWLARSRLPSGDGREDDLFAGVPGAKSNQRLEKGSDK